MSEWRKNHLKCGEDSDLWLMFRNEATGAGEGCSSLWNCCAGGGNVFNYQLAGRNWISDWRVASITVQLGFSLDKRLAGFQLEREERERRTWRWLAWRERQWWMEEVEVGGLWTLGRRLVSPRRDISQRRHLPCQHQQPEHLLLITWDHLLTPHLPASTVNINHINCIGDIEPPSVLSITSVGSNLLIIRTLC